MRCLCHGAHALKARSLDSPRFFLFFFFPFPPPPLLLCLFFSSEKLARSCTCAMIAQGRGSTQAVLVKEQLSCCIDTKLATG